MAARSDAARGVAPPVELVVASASSRVIIIAPFEREQEFGGSLRATALAERLEDRGFAVEWVTLAPRSQGLLAKAFNLVRLQPNLVHYHAARPVDVAPAQTIALAAHSYMAPYLDEIVGAATRVVDFHNLEWRHLASLAQLESGVRRVHLSLQSRLMRRFEAGIPGRADVVTFVSAAEAAWVGPTGSGARALLVPSVLPRATAGVAERVWEARSVSTPREELLYLGQLMHRPNALSLLRFLRDVWPLFRRRRPDLRLRVVGELPGSLAIELERFPAVTAAGFVPDLASLLVGAGAVVLPVESTAGTSVRVLLLALAGVPIIGSPLAFRGLTFEAGRVATSASEWIDGVEHALAGGHDVREIRRRALVVQHDAAPWEALAGLLSSQAVDGAGKAGERALESGTAVAR